jgi:protein-S-isoprenylcysteine O-methyltransferase
MATTAHDESISGHPDISWPTNRSPENGARTLANLAAQRDARQGTRFQQPPSRTTPKELFPGGERALAGIALRAFLLGLTLGLCLILTTELAYYHNRLWRAPFFIATLCVFHFLEFWTTAEYNTKLATVSAFLLTNGDRYRQAHTVALIETLVTSYFFPQWQSRVSPPIVQLLGIAMIVAGQTVRSLAMAQAGTNFNHQVQSRKNEGHELVTTGMYAVFRHPAYFGFFWWGLGTQVVLGNVISFVGYAGVLWYFFYTRIRHEEKHLISFFGNDYTAYKRRTKVWIPFIR